MSDDPPPVFDEEADSDGEPQAHISLEPDDEEE